MKKALLSGLLILLVSITAIYCKKHYKKPKIYDCFMFFNELDILELRFHEMYDAVDEIVLIESTKTYQGIPKPLYFNDNKQRYAPYLKKIHHVIIDTYPKFNPKGDQDYWEMETYQRDHLSKALKPLCPNKRDIILYSDVDEIIRKEKIDEIKDLIDKKGNDIIWGEFDWYQHFLNRKVKGSSNITIATSWGVFSKYIHSGALFRFFGDLKYDHLFRFFENIKKNHHQKKWSFARIKDIGWHFSSIGHYSHLLEKFDATAHIEQTLGKAKDFDYIKASINSMEYCPINSSFQEYIQKNQEELKARGLIDEEKTTFHR